MEEETAADGARAERRRRSRGVAGAGEDDDPEEHHLNPFLAASPSPSKPQFRKEASRARWVEAAGAAEVVDKKGSLWATTGVVRASKIYCHVEEIGFLAERGALVLLDNNDAIVGVKDIYKKIAGGNYGCSWDSYQAYRHLKLLGYIIGRYDVPWTMKCDSSCNAINSPPSTADSAQLLDKEVKGGSNCITKLLNEMHIDEIYPSFEVYLPNSKFKKSSPGVPRFLLCLLRNKPPSRDVLENLEKKFEGIPLKFCYVNYGRVSFFSLDKVILPCLP